MDIKIWELLAGLGIFLFGIMLLEESVKNLSGRSFKQFIRKYTNSRIKSIFSGAFATAVLQSSSAVSLIVLAFSSAGVLGLESAIGVIIGSNVGTTLTSWIVATIGFKVNIESLALPFIGIGGLGLIFFGKSTRATNVSKLLVGFGFLFMGLDYMKNGMNTFATSFDLQSFSGSSVFFFILIGFAFTAIVQSSSATMAIALSLLHAGIITFHDAAAMVIGINLGTTVTVMLGTLGGQVVKKRVAYSHLIFNVVTSVFMLLTLPWSLKLITITFYLGEDPIIALAVFHTLFNVMGVLLFFPFIKSFAQLVKRLTPEKKNTLARYITTFSTEAPEAAIAAFHQETQRLLFMVLNYTLRSMRVKKSMAKIPADGSMDEQAKKTLPLVYEELKQLEIELYTYTARIQTQPLRHEDATMLNHYLIAVKNTMSVAKIMKDNLHHLEELEQADNELMKKLFETLQHYWITLTSSIVSLVQHSRTAADIATLHNLSKRIEENTSQLTHTITHGIEQKQFTPAEVLHPLAANRAYMLGAELMIHAVKDLMFTLYEMEVYDHLEESTASSESS